MLKKDLIKKCLDILQEKKNLLEKNIELAIEASRDDTKSSAGDKYETTRAMMQIEIDSNKKRLIENNVLENILLSIETDITYQKIALGSVFITSQGKFFLSIGLGQVKLEQDTFFVISPDAPIGKEFLNKKIQEKVFFNQKEYQILEIF